MKVLHVIPSVSPLRGGPSETLRAMVGGLMRSGITVEVATTDDHGAARLPVACARADFKTNATYRYFRRQSAFYTFSWPLTRWLSRHIGEFDLVHIHALFSYPALAAAYFAKRHGVPYIVRPLGVLNCWGMTQRRSWLKKISFALLERHILNAAALVQYSSEDERLEAGALGVRQRWAVTSNPVNLPPAGFTRGLFRALHPDLAGRSIILFLSRLDPKKGLDILLTSFAALRARCPSAALVIAGDGASDFEAALRRQARRLGIERDVVWTGFLSGAQKSAALADADVFVLPSYSENFGVAAVEALAAGLPVIVSDRVGIHREISQAHAGIIVSCDAEQIARAMSQLLGDSELRARMGSQAARLARTLFSPEAATEKLVAIYRQVCRAEEEAQSRFFVAAALSGRSSETAHTWFRR